MAVEKGDLLVNMDSQAPNKAAAEALPWLFPGITGLRPEAVFGESRLDFCADLGEKKLYVEVKGCTLEEDGVALFPDAPTERGVKHLHGLIRAVAEGYGAFLVIVIQMRGIRYFEPNWATHAAFGEAMREAQRAGVRLLALNCDVAPEELSIANPVEIRL